MREPPYSFQVGVQRGYSIRKALGRVSLGRMSDKTKDQPDPSEPQIDYEQEFLKLDAKLATGETPQTTGDSEIKEVRVQLRGAVFAENPAIELRVGDQIIAYIQGKDAALIAASAERLGTEGNTVVMWGYLPPEEETA